jgi:hypothetical protein
VQTDAADEFFLAFDNRNTLAELGGADGGLLSAGAAADHYQVKTVHG